MKKSLIALAALAATAGVAMAAAEQPSTTIADKKNSGVTQQAMAKDGKYAGEVLIAEMFKKGVMMVDANDRRYIDLTDDPQTQDIFTKMAGRPQVGILSAKFLGEYPKFGDGEKAGDGGDKKRGVVSAGKCSGQVMARDGTRMTMEIGLRQLGVEKLSHPRAIDV